MKLAPTSNEAQNLLQSRSWRKKLIPNFSADFSEKNDVMVKFLLFLSVVVLVSLEKREIMIVDVESATHCTNRQKYFRVESGIAKTRV